MRIGYARVSSKSQHLGRQLKILKHDKCKKIYKEKISGATTRRPQLRKMLKFVRQGDIVEVVALDRLGRNAKDNETIINQLKDKGVNLDINNLKGMRPPIKYKGESENAYKESLNTYNLIDGILLKVLNYVAETERREIRERQQQGIKLAKANHKYTGRKRKFDLPKIRNRVINQYKNRKVNHLTTADIAHLNQMSVAEVYYLKNKYSDKK